MANRIKGITIEIGGDTTQLDKALSETNSKLKDTQADLKSVERLLKLDPGNTELLAQKQRLLGEAVKETGDKLKTMKDAASQANDALAKGKINREQYDAIQLELIETEEAYKRAQKAASDFNATAEKLKAVGSKLQETGDKISAAGSSLLPLSAAIAGLGVAAVKTASDFDSAMSQVAAVSGATGDDLDALRDKAREMGAKTKFSASEAAEAMNYMAMAGWKTEDMLNGIEGIMNLAAASGEDLATTSDIVTDALTAFGLKAEDAGHFADILAAASSNANTNVSMMGETFQYVAPVAGALGYSAEDTAIAIGLMANSGIKASQAGTSLRTILTNLASPTSKMSASMDELGISLTDDQGNMLSLMDVIGQLREGFSGGSMAADDFAAEVARLEEALETGEISEETYTDSLDELLTSVYGVDGAEKARLASMLAGKNAMSGLLAIVNASDEDLAKLSESIYGSSEAFDGMGTAAHQAEVMQDNLEGQTAILKSQMEELANSFGEMMMPVLRQLMDLLKDVLDWLNGLDEETKETILTVALVVAAIGPLLMVVGNVISTVGTITSAIGGLITFITSPVGIIVAIVAAVAALVTLWETSDKFRSALKSFDEWLTGIFVHDWTENFGAVGEVLNAFFKNAQNIYESVKKVLKGIVDFVAGVFKGDWKRAWEGVKSIFEGVLEGFVSVVAVPINNIIGMINFLLGAATDGINAVTRLMNKISFDIPDWVPGIGGQKFGFNFKDLTAPKIPYLAQGAVMRANDPRLVVVGDNRTEEEIIAPYSTIKRAAWDAMLEMGSGVSVAALTAAFTAALSGVAVYMDGYAVGRLARIRQANTARAYGG